MLTVVILGILALIAAAIRARGVRAGAWYGWVVALTLVPLWVFKSLGSMTIDGRLVAALACLACLAASPEGRPRRLVGADVALALLFGVIITSQLVNGHLGVTMALWFVQLWLLPYLMGRLLYRSAADIPRALRVICPCVAILAMLAVAEAVTHVSFFRVASGATGDAGVGFDADGSMIRMGLLRASGSCIHPISFALLLVMFLPWTLEAARRARAGAGPAWWRLVPWALGVGVVVTVSRGAILAGVLAVAIDLFIRHRRLRAPMLAAGALAAVAAWAASETILAKAESVAGETERVVVINGEERQYSSSLHRLLLFDVYWDQITTTGLLGSGHPESGPENGDDELGSFRSVDNHYLILFMRNGFAGLGCFLALGVCALRHLAWAARAGGEDSALAVALGATFFVVAVDMFTVWLAPDYGAVWLFTAGVAASLRDHAGGAAPVARPGHAAVDPW